MNYKNVFLYQKISQAPACVTSNSYKRYNFYDYMLYKKIVFYIGPFGEGSVELSRKICYNTKLDFWGIDYSLCELRIRNY